MKNKCLLSLMLLVLPSFSYASGQDVLPLLGGELIVIILFVISLFILKISTKGKVLLVIVFLTSLLLASLITMNLPYTANKFLVNMLMLGLPVLAVVMVLVLLKKN